MKRSVVLALVLLALAARWAHFAAMRDEPVLRSHLHYPSSDQYLFDQWARRLAAGDWLGREVYHPLVGWQTTSAPAAKWNAWTGTTPVYYKAPFYAYLIALLYRLASDVTVPLLVLQVLVSAAAVALLAVLTARCFGELTGVAAGVLFALYAPAIHFDLVMLRGPWVVLAVLLVTGALMRLNAQPRPSSSLLLGAAVGFALLVNEAFVVLPVLLVPFLAVRSGEGGERAEARPWRHRASIAVAFVAGMLAVLAPLVVRNVVVGVPALSLAVTGSTVYAVFNSAGSSPWFFAAEPTIYVPILERAGGALLPTIVGCWQSFGGTAEAIGFYLLRSIAVVMPFEIPDNANFYYAALRSPILSLLPGYGLLVPLAAAGLLVAARERRRAALIWVPGLLALLASLYVASPSSRYRATFAVLLMPFAALAITALAGAVRRRRWRRALAMVAAVAVIAVAVATLQRRVVFAEVDPDLLRYRGPEFILAARWHAEHHDLAAAARELMQLAQRSPDPAMRVDALLILARLASDAGDTALAQAARGAAAAQRRAATGAVAH